MIASLNFEKTANHSTFNLGLTRGVRRIDELLAVVLARYEVADGEAAPESLTDGLGEVRAAISADGHNRVSKARPK